MPAKHQASLLQAKDDRLHSKHLLGIPDMYGGSTAVLGRNTLLLIATLAGPSCRHLAGSQIKTASAAATCCRRARPLALLKAALLDRPLAQVATGKTVSLSPISVTTALTSAEALGRRPRALSWTFGDHQPSSIAIDRDVAVVTFDKPVFPLASVHTVYPQPLSDQSPLLLTAPSPHVQPITQTVLDASLSESGHDVASTTVQAGKAGDATPSPFTGPIVAMPGFLTTTAQARARKSEATAGPFDAGASAGSPIFINAGGITYLAGIVQGSTEAQVDQAASGSAVATTAYASTLSDDQTKTFLTNLAPGSIGIPEIAKESGDSFDRDTMIDIRDVLFGPEFEFTTASGNIKTFAAGSTANDWNDYGATNQEATVLAYMKRVKEFIDQDGGAITFTDQSFILYNHQVFHKGLITDTATGASIQIHPYEDKAVLEIPLGPLTLDQLQSAKPLIQRYVYDVAKSLDLLPGTEEVNRWSCHINLSWPGMTSPEHKELFLRFFIDTLNFAELSMGVLGGDLRNASPPAIWADDSSERSLVEIVGEFNKSPGTFDSTLKLADRIWNSVLKGTYQWSSPKEHSRFQLVNLLPFLNRDSDVRMSNDQDLNTRAYDVPSTERLELRGFHMPTSADGFINSCTIIASRLDFLARRGGEISYEPKGYRKMPGFSEAIDPKNFKAKGMQLGIDPVAAVGELDRYLTEAGLKLSATLPFLRNAEVRTIAEGLIASRNQQANETEGPHGDDAADSQADWPSEDKNASPKGQLDHPAAR